MGAVVSAWPVLPEHHPKLTQPQPKALYEVQAVDTLSKKQKPPPVKEYYLCEGCEKKCASARSRMAHRKFCDEYRYWENCQKNWKLCIERSEKVNGTEPPITLVMQLLIESNFCETFQVLELVKIKNKYLNVVCSNWLLSIKGKRSRSSIAFIAVRTTLEKGYFSSAGFDRRSDGASLCMVSKLWRREFPKHCFQVIDNEDALSHARQSLGAIANPAVNIQSPQMFWLQCFDFSPCYRWFSDDHLKPIIFNCPNVISLNLAQCTKVSAGTLHVAFLHMLKLEAVDLRCCRLTNDLLKHLGYQCARLKSINIGGCGYSKDSAILVMAKYCKSIEEVRVSGCESLTHQSLAAFCTRKRSIKELDVSWCKYLVGEKTFHMVGKTMRDLVGLTTSHTCVNDQALIYLRKCVLLESIDLSFCTQITDERMAVYFEHLVHLKEINLSGCENVGDATLKIIAQACPLVRTLNLKLVTLLTDESVMALAKSKCAKILEVLILDHCSAVSGESIKALANRCNILRSLSLSCLDKVTDDSIICLSSRMKKLETLDLQCCSSITNAALISVSWNSTDNNQIATAGLAHCGDQLKFVNVSRTKCTKDAVKAFSRLNPKCHVEFYTATHEGRGKSILNRRLTETKSVIQIYKKHSLSSP